MKFILTVNGVVWLETTSSDEAFAAFRRWAGHPAGRGKVNLEFIRLKNVA